MTGRKLAEADAQIQTLRRHVAEECVAIASSIDAIPPAMVPARCGRPRQHESQVRAERP
jgi:hypothetical protein